MTRFVLIVAIPVLAAGFGAGISAAGAAPRQNLPPELTAAICTQLRQVLGQDAFVKKFGSMAGCQKQVAPIYQRALEACTASSNVPSCMVAYIANALGIPLGGGGGGDGDETPAKDTKPPTVTVDPRGLDKPGALAPGTRKLGFSVTDDSGKAKVTAALYDGGERVWRPSVSSLRPAKGGRYTWTVRVPADLKGPVFYCVGAEDASGNRSTKFPNSSCAWLSYPVKDIDRVSNGCGGAQWGDYWAAVQNFFLDKQRYDNGDGRRFWVSFRAACNLHDAGYAGVTVRDPFKGNAWVDFRTWSRLRVDQQFRRDLMTLCEQHILADATTAKHACMFNLALPPGAAGYYQAVRAKAKAAYDANPTKPGVQTSGPRSNR